MPPEEYHDVAEAQRTIAFLVNLNPVLWDLVDAEADKITAGYDGLATAEGAAYGEALGDLIATIESNGAPAPGSESATPTEETTAPAPSGDAVEFGLPFMGDGIDEAQVVSVMVSVGDAVDVEAEIVEVECPEPVTMARMNDTIAKAEAATIQRKWMAAQPNDYGHHVYVRAEAGFHIPATQYIEALALRGRFIEMTLDAVFGR